MMYRKTMRMYRFFLKDPHMEYSKFKKRVLMSLQSND